MSLFKTLNPSQISRNKHISLLSVFLRTLTSVPSQNQTSNKKPLSVLFEEAVGLRKKADSDSENDTTNVLKNGLKELEREVRDLKAKNQETVSVNFEKKEETKKVKGLRLYSLFVNGKRVTVEEKNTRERREEEGGTYPKKGEEGGTYPKKEEEGGVLKELSPDMETFVNHLYKEGYFSKGNFLRPNQKRLDFGCFDENYGRDFIKFAAEKFGKDHQEIAKWLSGSDLRTIALFGCPSTTKKTVFSAKQLRRFFKIQEDTVCHKCVLKESCKFVNQSIWKGQHENLNLVVVMRVITRYALESVPPQLVVPDEVKASVSRLFKEVMNLSETTHKATSTISV
ncbi:uncharacterized protein LOC116135802 [Pistacia vera]|uniref:uncharacterized protein LOC116135802 n=1 Tax=Pistacia vera TaxID=55513 RepID=UPI001262F640|nr:uncharacterized protein LOC116135802 [Pistacia vera]XP_031277383.1 uncharacterized protein LOC116135802 [Pistacia vera]